MPTVIQATFEKWSRQACPRCRGKLMLDFDRFGHYVTCLQCSKVLSEEEERVLLGIPAGAVLRFVPGATFVSPAEPTPSLPQRAAS